MKRFVIPIGFALFLANAALAHEQSLLACVTVYWSTGNAKCDRAHGTGARLRTGHCAVDPRKIPYGSKVVFPDGPCTAVDTGPSVINRKAARLAGRNSSERNALVIDRFFETKRQALAWAQAHPHFMTVRIVPPGSEP
jgi:3D (Asp-Asp-Asp) domain-containing protein